MIDNKAKLYTLVYSDGRRENVHGSFVYVVGAADDVIASYVDIPYVDVYLRDIHRARVYSIDARDAGSPPIMYLSNVNQPLTPAA